MNTISVIRIVLFGTLATMTSTNASAEKITIDADIWADNWFSLHVEEQLVFEDSVPITTERSFNKESFSFEVTLPAQLNLVLKDFKENNTGLEYIGSRRQQMGDGGLIAQFIHGDTGETLLVSNDSFRCMVTHRAPLNKGCEKSNDPEKDCQVESFEEPEGWMLKSFDDSSWAQATVYSEREVSPKHGYDQVRWDDQAELIWTSDLETDNTLLCRATIEKN